MKANHDFAADGVFEAEAVGANGNASVGADLEEGALAPNVRPPRATWGWAQDGAFFFACQIPSVLGSHLQFAVGFVAIAMAAQMVDVGVGDFDFLDLFAGEIGGQTALPKLVFAFDFALGLGGGGIQEANVVKFEGGSQLRESVGIPGKKDGVVIDVNLQWAAVAQEGRRQEVEVRQEEFAAIYFGADE